MADTLLYNIPGFGLVYVDAATLQVVSPLPVAGATAVTGLTYAIMETLPGAVGALGLSTETRGTTGQVSSGSVLLVSPTVLTSGGVALTGSFPVGFGAVSDGLRLTIADLSRAPVSLHLSSGMTMSGVTLSSGDAGYVSSGATLAGSKVNNSASLVVGGGVTSALDIAFNGTAKIAAGSSVYTRIDAGGTLTVNGGGSVDTDVFGLEIASGGVLFGNTVHSGGQLLLIGGTAVSTAVTTLGALVVSGGDDTDAYVGSGGDLFVLAGTDSRTTVAAGGTLTVSGGTDTGGKVQSGGVADAVGSGVILGMTVSSGGTLELQAGGVASGTILLAGGSLDLATVTFRAGGSAAYDASTGLLSVTEGGPTVTASLTRDAAGLRFMLTDDGSGGTLVTGMAADSATSINNGTVLGSGGIVFVDGSMLSSSATEIVAMPSGPMMLRAVVSDLADPKGTSPYHDPGLSQATIGAIYIDNAALFTPEHLSIASSGGL